MPIDKADLRAQLLAILEVELQTAITAQKAAQEAATHAEARPEHAKDTRAIEQSYLARGQAARVAALVGSITNLRKMSVAPLAPDDVIVVGALATLQRSDGVQRNVFLVQDGGGVCLAGDIHAISSKSPLGAALLECGVGDVAELEKPPESWTVLLLE